MPRTLEDHLQPLGEPFPNRLRQEDTGHLGMWIWIASEVMLFGGLFLAYTLMRGTYPDGFAAGSHELDRLLGTLNTFVLLTSSLAMALGERAAKTGQRRQSLLHFGAVLVLGTAFLAIKFYEYYEKVQAGHLPGPGFSYSGAHPQIVELFLFLYFTMTGLHALHMLAGLGAVGWLALTCLRKRHPEPLVAESVALYWHFVDIVWVFLFPCLYLIQ